MRERPAGHRGFLFRAGREAELLRPTGIPLNVDADYASEEIPPVELNAGDVILLYTDGVIECLSPEGELYINDGNFLWVFTSELEFIRKFSVRK